jgi:hypothetical protein
MKLRFLRIILGFAGLVWIASCCGSFIRWPVAEVALEGLGAQPIGYDRTLDYWLRMAAGAFTLIGCWFLALAIWPIRFRAAIPWFGTFMLLEGIILLVHGLSLSLPPFPFYADSGVCLLPGCAMVVLSKLASADEPPAAKVPAATF